MSNPSSITGPQGVTGVAGAPGLGGHPPGPQGQAPSSSNDLKKIPGTKLVWARKKYAYRAQPGATAIVEAYDDPYIEVKWVRDGLDSGQLDGGYLPGDFDLPASTPGATTILGSGGTQLSRAIVVCNCSNSDFIKYGCRYTKNPDPQGLIHS